MAKKKKTERDELSEHCKLLTKLLMNEASGGIIPLPKGVEKYTPPPIPFSERRALLDSASKGLLIDMKVNPNSEMSGFELLKDELNERTRKRDRAQAASRGDSSSPNGLYSADGDESDDFLNSAPN